jgi:hypothetical protein
MCSTITEICVQEAQYIEYRHVLIRVQPAYTVSDFSLSRVKDSFT